MRPISHAFAVSSLASSIFIGVVPVSLALAQDDYPSETVRLVVPFPPGGGTDFIARLITDRLTEQLPQPVIIDNRPGAATIIGVEYVRNASPDGHTLLMATNSYVSNAVMTAEATYEPLDDFELITLVGIAPNLMTVGAQSPYDSFELLVEAARDPEAVSYVSYGPASAQVFSFHAINQALGIELTDITYPGHSGAFAGVLSNEVDILFPSITAVLSSIQGGQLKALAFASDERSPLLPEVPTFRELGLELELGTWYGIMAPAGTPDHVVEKLHAEISGVLDMDEVRGPLEAQGVTVRAWGGEEFREMVAGEIAQWEAFRSATE